MLEPMGKPGRPKQFEEDRVTKAVRISHDLDARLKEVAVSRDTSVNMLINRAIENYLDALKPIDEVLAVKSA